MSDPIREAMVEDPAVLQARYSPNDNYWCCGECHPWPCACGEYHCGWFDTRCPRQRRAEPETPLEGR